MTLPSRDSEEVKSAINTVQSFEATCNYDGDTPESDAFHTALTVLKAYQEGRLVEKSEANGCDDNGNPITYGLK